MSQQMIEENSETSYGRIFRHENGIVYIYAADDTSFDLPKAIQIVKDISALDNSGQARLLIVQGYNNDMSFAAQNYLGKANISSHVALVVRSRLQAEVAQFFVSLLNFLRSTYVMQIFSQLDSAEKWLLDQK